MHKVFITQTYTYEVNGSPEGKMRRIGIVIHVNVEEDHCSWRYDFSFLE